jgi:hypothetical protein
MEEFAYYNHDLVPVGIILNPKTLKPYGVSVALPGEEEGGMDVSEVIIHTLSKPGKNYSVNHLSTVGSGYFDAEIGIRGKPREFRRNPDGGNWQGQSKIREAFHKDLVQRRLANEAAARKADPKAKPKNYQKCLRSHTPSGVIVPGQGLGFVLYSGMVLAVAMQHGHDEWVTVTGSEPLKDMGYSNLTGQIEDSFDYDPCIYSVEGFRSDSADTWWEVQGDRNLIDKYDYCDTNTIDIPKKNIVPIEAATKKRVIREINKQIAEYKNLDGDHDYACRCGKTKANYDPKCKGERCKELKFLHARKKNIKIQAKVQYESCIPDAYQIYPIDHLLATRTVISARWLNERFRDPAAPTYIPGRKQSDGQNVKKEFMPSVETLLSMDLIDVSDPGFVTYIKKIAKYIATAPLYCSTSHLPRRLHSSLSPT